ncbi:mitochondrial cytochrome c oxidase subunit VIa [Mucidula mucida]|nr:mitochondrial cytochrome c oxidase subunit VIa [Mucidula mucida]
MSFVARNAFRAVLRPRAARGFAADIHAPQEVIQAVVTEAELANSAYLKELEAVHHHGAETGDLWRKISYYVCIPAIIVCGAYVYNLEVKHNEHLDHLRAENDGKLPEPPAYEYLNRRVKPFPWGANSLFFNPAVQKDMSDA